MKFYQYLFLTMFMFFCLLSCKKSFLDVPITREVVAEDYIKDLATANELLTGTYLTIARDLYTGSVVAYADIAADNGKDLGSVLAVQYSWSMIPSETDDYGENMNAFWLHSYNAIRYCNFLLEHIDQFRSEDPIVADGIKGQAFGLRALIHFNLVNVFAQPYDYTADASHPGVPYDTIYAQTQLIKRQPVNDVYRHITADLQRAIELMPASLTRKDAFNSIAVKAFLARVYLFQADYPNANRLSAEIASRIPLMPSSDYPGKLFTPEDNESLFWLSPATPTTSGSTSFQGRYFAETYQFSATEDLVNLINERSADLRKVWFRDTVEIRQITKFPLGSVAGISDPKDAYYQTVIRSSEMYLTAAETYAQLGKEDNARYYLDAIRQRADATAPASSATGSALLDSIYKERRKELCFENLRMYDLLRLKKDIFRMDVNSPAPAHLPFPDSRAIAPIPLNDVRVYNLEQNPGY